MGFFRGASYALGWASSLVADIHPVEVGGYIFSFKLVGVLLELIRPLREAGVPVLAISTFDTDWILVDEGRGPVAEAAWRSAGIELVDHQSGGQTESRVRERRDGDL